jgi:hypothetical protein
MVVVGSLVSGGNLYWIGERTAAFSITFAVAAIIGGFLLIQHLHRKTT